MSEENLTPPGLEHLTPLDEALNREIYEFLLEEYKKKGDQLFEWYRERFLPNKIGLAHYDIAIARFYREHCGAFDRFVEIGAGAGQQSILLAAHRIKTTPVESDFKQLDLMKRLIDRIAQRIDPELPKYIEPIDDWYPTRAAQYVDSRVVLSFPTLAATMPPGAWERLLKALPAAGAVIVNLAQFFWYRASEEERQQLIGDIRKQGFEAPEDVCAWQTPYRTFIPNRIVYMKRSPYGAIGG